MGPLYTLNGPAWGLRGGGDDVESGVGDADGVVTDGVGADVVGADVADGTPITGAGVGGVCVLDEFATKASMGVSMGAVNAGGWFGM